MRKAVLPIVLPALCAALAACGSSGGAGDENTDPTPSPPPAANPPPAAPAPGNAAPVANAGENRATVEEQDVTIDGSRTTDPENGAITYAWQLVSAPPGSGVTVNATTPTFIFRPDVPGRYQLQLTASDGSASSTDTVEVTAEALLAFEDEVRFEIEVRRDDDDDDDDDDDEDQRRRELELRTSERYAGEPVSFTVTTDASWLRVLEPTGRTARAGDSRRVPMELVMEEVRRLPEGEHQARVTATPAGGWEQVATTVTLEVKRNDSGSLAPYVAYSGTASRLGLYGTDLLQAHGQGVFIDRHRVAQLESLSDQHAVIDLQPLAPGEYRVRLGTTYELSRDVGRLVVRDKPIYRDVEIALPGVARSLEYDAERDALYAVLAAADGQRRAVRLQNSGSGEWVGDAIAVEAPWALALTADGRDLLVTADACTVYRVEPQSLRVLESRAREGCDPAAERLGALATLADGRVFVVDEAKAARMWTYPDFTPAPVAGPQALAVPVLNADRTRFVWDAKQGALALDPAASSASRTIAAPSGTATFTFTMQATGVNHILIVRTLQ